MSGAERIRGAGNGAIVASLSGEDTASACGHVVRSSAPVLALCRILVAAGFDPALQLLAYRGGTLCLVVRSIAEGAGLEIGGKGVGFVRRQAVGTASPISGTAQAYVRQRKRAPAHPRARAHVRWKAASP